VGLCVNDVNFTGNSVTFLKTVVAPLCWNETENLFEDFYRDNRFCAIGAAFNQSGC